MHWTSAAHALVMTCLRVWDITHSVPFVFVAGIAFLRGFQVSLQALGGSSVACQLFLFNRNLSLTVSHAQMVGRASRYLSLFSCLLCCFWQNKLFTRVLMLFYSQECFWVWVWINNKIILFIWIKFFLIFFFHLISSHSCFTKCIPSWPADGEMMLHFGWYHSDIPSQNKKTNICS